MMRGDSIEKMAPVPAAWTKHSERRVLTVRGELAMFGLGEAGIIPLSRNLVNDRATRRGVTRSLRPRYRS